MPSIWIDGEYYEKDTARVSVFDHGLLYGDGVFEGIRAYGGRIFRLPQHLNRLYASAKALMLNIPMTKDQMTTMVQECTRLSGLGDAYIRLVVTRGYGDLGFDPTKCPKPTVICIVDKISLWPDKVYTSGLTAITSSIPVNQPSALAPQIKSLNYVSHIMAKLEANNAGADEAIMLEATGVVAEATGQNLFCVNGRRVRTTPGSAGILRGITRDAVLELAVVAGYQVREETLTRYDLYTADEVFLCGTAAEVVGVVRLDGRKIGCGQVGQATRDLGARFQELAKQGG